MVLIASLICYCCPLSFSLSKQQMTETSRSMHSTRKTTAAALLTNGYSLHHTPTNGGSNGRRRHVSASRIWANGTCKQACTLGDLINGMS